ncbi:hypothetical protein F7P10_19120 [Actinomadura sp. WMMB 499]|nr:hypothetical protein F7P10_19120 [Actinomadura sp. WMMB 499]
MAELTGMGDLSGGRRECGSSSAANAPNPGARLRSFDSDRHRITCFVTGTHRGQFADQELRHRHRARCEDRIRCAKDTGVRNLPLHDFAANQLWLEVVVLVADLTTWAQMLAFKDHPARCWEPKRLRLRVFLTAAAMGRLQVLPAP